ncbi:uroporphyrinogen decarboxylase [Methylophilaceae bacterium]|jgi:uroporphyrinogen decarboxylase|nr:uroporphyrinogen decarboxylase [Methylophilaceae bacterium]
MTTIINDVFMKTLLREKTPYTPVWIMRQAGRYLPEYRETRKKAGSFLDLCKNQDFATEVTMQPLERYPNLDAAILFSDILTVPDAMGLGLYFQEGEGPKFKYPLQNEKAIQKLDIPDVEEKLAYVFKAVKSIKSALKNKVPLIGFTGSPWTLATYMVEGEGGSDFLKIKKMLYSRPDLLNHILKINTETVTKYLACQIDAGADVVMIFDSWGGALAHNEYESYSLNYMKVIISNLNLLGYKNTPKIIFTKGGGQWIKAQANSGADALGVDWQTSLGSSRKLMDDKVALQGNLDPTILLSNPKSIEESVKKVLDDYGYGEGHIFNLGHGITQFTPPENLQVLLETVRNYSVQYHQD